VHYIDFAGQFTHSDETISAEQVRTLLLNTAS